MNPRGHWKMQAIKQKQNWKLDTYQEGQVHVVSECTSPIWWPETSPIWWPENRILCVQRIVYIYSLNLNSRYIYK